MLASAFTTFLIGNLGEAKVFDLVAENFDKFIAEHPKTLVKFYAPWCGHCKRLAPEWETASDSLDGKMVLAEMNIDLEENRSFKERFSIEGLPAIKYFDGEDVSDYDGGRTSDMIISWVQTVMTEPVIFMGGREDVSNLRAERPEECFLAYEGSMRPGNAEFGNFQAFCKDHRSLIQCVAYPGTDGEQPVMELFRPSNTSTRVLFDWETTAEEMKKFVRGERIEYFAKITSDNHQPYLDSGMDIVWFVGTTSEYNAVKEEAEKVSKRTRGSYAWAWLDIEEMAREVEAMFSISSGPAFIVSSMQGKVGTYRGPMKTDVTEDELAAFIKAVDAGEADLYLKSEEIPEDNDGPVRVLVGKNLKDVTDAAEKFLLVIHAPWCGHCKTFMPVFQELAEKLAHTGIHFYTFDATANETRNPDFEYSGFPTIYYKGGMEQKPVRYLGQREVNDMVKYLKVEIKDEVVSDGKDEL